MRENAPLVTRFDCMYIDGVKGQVGVNHGSIARLYTVFFLVTDKYMI